MAELPASQYATAGSTEVPPFMQRFQAFEAQRFQAFFQDEMEKMGAEFQQEINDLKQELEEQDDRLGKMEEEKVVISRDAADLIQEIEKKDKQIQGLLTNLETILLVQEIEEKDKQIQEMLANLKGVKSKLSHRFVVHSVKKNFILFKARLRDEHAEKYLGNFEYVKTKVVTEENKCLNINDAYLTQIVVLIRRGGHIEWFPGALTMLEKGDYVIYENGFRKPENLSTFEEEIVEAKDERIKVHVTETFRFPEEGGLRDYMHNHIIGCVHDKLPSHLGAMDLRNLLQGMSVHLIERGPEGQEKYWFPGPGMVLHELDVLHMIIGMKIDGSDVPLRIDHVPDHAEALMTKESFYDLVQKIDPEGQRTRIQGLPQPQGQQGILQEPPISTERIKTPDMSRMPSQDDEHASYQRGMEELDVRSFADCVQSNQQPGPTAMPSSYFPGPMPHSCTYPQPTLACPPPGFDGSDQYGMPSSYTVMPGPMSNGLNIPQLTQFLPQPYLFPDLGGSNQFGNQGSGSYPCPPTSHSASSSDPWTTKNKLTSQTVRICNIDYKMKRKELKQKLDENGYGCDQNGEPYYNFLYVVFADDAGQHEGNNRGFAFINFVSIEAAHWFHDEFHGKSWRRKRRGENSHYAEELIIDNAETTGLEKIRQKNGHFALPDNNVRAHHQPIHFDVGPPGQVKAWRLLNGDPNVEGT